jgi:hypothetical protein
MPWQGLGENLGRADLTCWRCLVRAGKKMKKRTRIIVNMLLKVIKATRGVKMIFAASRKKVKVSRVQER